MQHYVLLTFIAAIRYVRPVKNTHFEAVPLILAANLCHRYRRIVSGHHKGIVRGV